MSHKAQGVLEVRFASIFGTKVRLTCSPSVPISPHKDHRQLSKVLQLRNETERGDRV